MGKTVNKMTQIIQLEGYRFQEAAHRVFGAWRKRFGESYGRDTRFPDLSDSTLYFLAQPGRESDEAYYELIMGALDLGKAAKFYYLGNANQIKVVDIHLFLGDQVRFEMMRRLGWLDRFASKKYPLIEIVMTFDKVRSFCSGKSPDLSTTHPGYAAFEGMLPGDKEAFVRRLLPEALDGFKKRLENR